MKRELRKITSAQHFRATFDASSIDKDKRTIDVVFATEREVMMYNWNIGLFREILICDSNAGDLSRLNNGAPLCDTHDTSSVKNGLGVVVRAWFDNGVGRATVRFSKRKDVEDVWQDVQDGIITGVSVGYTPLQYEITEENGKLPLYRATKWQASEISMALVQADQDSAVGRANETKEYEVEIISKNLNNNTMKRSSEILKLVRAAGLDLEFAQTLIDDESITAEMARTKIDAKKAELANPPAPAKIPAPPAPAEGDENVRKQATKAANKRSSEILTSVRAAGFDADFAQILIDDETLSVDQARAKIFEKMASERSQQNPTNAHNPGIVVNADERDKKREAQIIGLSLRSGQLKEKDFKPEQISGAREFRGRKLISLAADCLESENVNVRNLDDRAIAKRAITSSTSDFPIILEGVINRILLNNYQAVADTWRQFCMIGSVSDFRDHKRLRMGSFTRLDQVGENGELKNKSIPDAEFEKIAAKTFGNIINVSREMIINDDLNAFSRLAAMLGRAANRSIELDVYALLALNSGTGPIMQDGVALFDAAHGNLVTGAAPTALVFDGMRVKMAQQKDPSNNDFLDLRPSVLLIGIGQGATARVINDALYDPDTANKLQKPNLAKGIFNQIVDTAQISGNQYYGFANPSEEPVLEVAFLNGVQTPYLEQEKAFNQLGMSWRVFLDYAVGAIGWRGAVKNPGA